MKPYNKISDEELAAYLEGMLSSEDAARIDAGMNIDTLEVLSGIMGYPIWHLGCTISQEAVSLSYEAMSGKKMEE